MSEDESAKNDDFGVVRRRSVIGGRFVDVDVVMVFLDRFRKLKIR
jgi:hypothetical protein